MSKYEKAKERILQKPTDYTYTEAKYLLGKIGFEERNKGKTSGSRVCFFREEDKAVILLHKPYPGDEMNRGAVSDLVDYLKDIGEL
ncbi:MAG: type II toxin-antitoxin system HicA family toxin [Lachnospiraceae bacterium]|nr:type II toxin-antitoxin system HicA family toxin [Lachnospiraceae bacterium]